MQLQESGEMYLETILILSRKQGSVRSLDIAEERNFSKPSVSRAVKLLRDGEYIVVDDTGHIFLTEVGREVAGKIYERHRVLESFLLSIGVSEEIAAQDACKMEHDISDTSLEAIKKYLAKEK